MISLQTAKKSGKMVIADTADGHGSDNQQRLNQHPDSFSLSDKLDRQTTTMKQQKTEILSSQYANYDQEEIIPTPLPAVQKDRKTHFYRLNQKQLY